MRPPLSVSVALPLALLFIASIVPSYGQNTLQVAEGAPLAVECALRPEQAAEWRRDGGAVPPDMRPAEAAGGGAALTARLTAPAARAHHAGLYTCGPGSPAVRVLLLRAGTDAAPADAGEGAAPDVVYYDLRGNFSLNCTGLSADAAAPISWSKNGTALEETAEFQRGHLILVPAEGVPNARLTLSERAVEADFGNYSCRAGEAGAAGAGGAERAWRLHARAHAKLSADTNVVEGQKLKLSCKLVGRPYPAVAWRYSNSSEFGNDTELAPGERVSIGASEQGAAGAELVLEPAARADAGWYRCAPAGGVAAVTQLRVKDMYAALWPFLGICAEVFVLCAIILVYERRRTKPEADDSDTDNHDQKKS